MEGEHLPGLTELVKTFIDTELRGKRRRGLLAAVRPDAPGHQRISCPPSAGGRRLRAQGVAEPAVHAGAACSYRRYRAFRTVFDWFWLEWADLGLWIDHVNHRLNTNRYVP